MAPTAESSSGPALSGLVLIALSIGTALFVVAIIVNFFRVKRERKLGGLYAAVANDDDNGDEIDMDAWVESCAVEEQEATYARVMNRPGRSNTAARIEHQVATNPLPAIHVAPSLESPQRGQIRIASPQSQPDMMADEFFDDPASPDHQIRVVS